MIDEPMIVEFIGSTGAGKTTLIEEVQRSLEKKVAVATPFDLVAERLGVRGITNISAQHIIQEIVGLPFFLRAINQHKEFIVFTLRMLARQANYTLYTINNLRSLERKIGAYEMIKRMNHDRIVLVDEGTILTAHNVFVYTSAVYTGEEIARFANLVPLPDTIVYIKAPVDVLVQRSLQRADPPREIKSKSRTQIEKYVTRAAKMFDRLVEAENIQCRLMIVDYHDFIEHGYGTIVDRISDFVLEKKFSQN